ncbi:lytic transglycosylase domain-containing protein [Acinetobacter bohemicus]|uniref:lytic transglycosylase domain-containing protein n=1 Tax=Acinetobacter bohemicus TaxID=1435036 RepID=UPI0040420E2C
MSNWLSEYSGEDQTQVDEINAKGIAHQPIQPKKEVGLFDGAASAIPRGALAGAIKVVDTVVKPFERVADHVGYSVNDTLNGGLDGALDVREPSFTEVHATKNKERQNKLVMEVEQLEDRENTGLIGSVGFGLSDYLTRAALGSLTGGLPGAISATGLSETNYSYDDLTHKGVDSSTALKAAAIDGVVAGGATALPLSYGFKGAGGVLGDAALSVAGATAITTGGRYASGQVLESEGYDKQAKKYEITAESVGTELILNGLLFGAGRYARSRSGNNTNADFIDGEFREPSSENIEARNTQVESALVLNEMQFEDAATPVRPSDPIQHNNHLKNMSEATENLKAGRPVNVAHSVKGEEKPKSITASKVSSYTNKPWAKQIAYEAERRGINPVDALVISHIETIGTFDPKIQPKNKKGELLSSATGLFQTLDGTFIRMGGKNKFDGNDQIRAGLNYYEYNSKIFEKQFDRKPNGLEVYYMHFFGEGGGPIFLKAKDNELFVDVATRWSKDGKKKTARQIAEGITASHKFNGMTVGQVKAKYQKLWNGVAKQYGGDGSSVQTAIGMDGTSYDMAYEVKSLDELIASNDAAYGVNPKYPSELQPRDRTDEVSRQQIENMANDLRPEWLGESPGLSDGAPIIGMDGVVESGNGRTLAIGKAYENGRAEEYRNYIEQYANEKGWDISGINKPVLVRTRLSDTDRVQFTKLANESDVAQFSASERAASDVDRLPDSSLLKINSDGNINLEQSMDFIRGFVDSLPKSEQGSVITADGRLSQDGKRRIESALTQRAYGDSSLVTRLSENLDDDSKTVLNALLRVAPQLAQLGDLVKQGGRHSNSIAQDLAQAAQKLSDLKANGVRVDDYLNQGQLIDDGLSTGAKDFLNVFDQNNRSAKAIGENIQSRIDEVESMGDPRKGSLFGDGPEEMEVLRILAENPNQVVAISRLDGDGNAIETTVPLKDYIEELNNDAKAAKEQGTAAEVAARCFLSYGV